MYAPPHLRAQRERAMESWLQKYLKRTTHIYMQKQQFMQIEIDSFKHYRNNKHNNIQYAWSILITIKQNKRYSPIMPKRALGLACNPWLICFICLKENISMELRCLIEVDMGCCMERKRWISRCCIVLRVVLDDYEWEDIQSKKYLHSSIGFVFEGICNKGKIECGL